MNVLDRLLEQETEATRSLAALCLGVSPEHWHKPFGFGQGTLYGTLDHLIDSKEYWSQHLLGTKGPFVPPPADKAQSMNGLWSRLEAITPIFLSAARRLRDDDQLSALFTDSETGPARRTYGAVIVHVATHGLHHCAQIRVMFDLLGVAYNSFGGVALDSHPIIQ